MLAFALASLALMAIPGPDMALIMRNAVVHGRRTGLATMLGGLAGISVHATASVVGLSALLATSAIVTTAPSCCSRRAVASPRPDAPPTTSAPLPSMSIAPDPSDEH